MNNTVHAGQMEKSDTLNATNQVLQWKAAEEVGIDDCKLHFSILTIIS